MNIAAKKILGWPLRAGFARGRIASAGPVALHRRSGRIVMRPAAFLLILGTAAVAIVFVLRPPSPLVDDPRLGRAELEIARGRPDEARKILDELAAEAPDDPWVRGGLAHLAMIEGDLAGAENILSLLLHEGAEAGDLARQAAALIQMAAVHERRGDPAAARRDLSGALAFGEQSGRAWLVARACAALGELARASGEFTQAEGLLARAVQSASRAGLGEVEAAAHGSLAEIHQVRGNPVAAAEHAQRAIMIYRRLDHARGLAYQYGKLASIRRDQGETDEVILLLELALEYARRGGDAASEAWAESELGRACMEAGDHPRAGTHLAGAARLHARLGMHEAGARDQITRGVLLLNAGRLAEAEDLFLETLTRIETLDLPTGRNYCMSNLGLVRLNMGDAEGAEEWFTRSMEESLKLGARDSLAVENENLGLIRSQAGDAEGASGYWNRAAGLWRELGREDAVAALEARAAEAGVTLSPSPAATPQSQTRSPNRPAE